MNTSTQQSAPADVYYVVEFPRAMGQRDLQMSSLLFETRPQAEREMARMRKANRAGVFGVRTYTTPTKPVQWLSDVVMADGTIIPATH
jgi:hypothetical protein